MKVDIAEAAAEGILRRELREGVWQNTKRALIEAFHAITRHDDEIMRIRQAARGSVSVSIDVKKGVVDAAQQGIDHLAQEIFEDQDAEGYVIHLRDNNIIKPDSISI
jgi:hypothetical protein